MRVIQSKLISRNTMINTERNNFEMFCGEMRTELKSEELESTMQIGKQSHHQTVNIYPQPYASETGHFWTNLTVFSDDMKDNVKPCCSWQNTVR